MIRWLFAAFLGVEAHFMASYLVPLDGRAKATFGGLLGWSWPWAYGDGGPLGRISEGSGMPMVGFYIAVTAGTLFFLAALSVVGLWVPYGWWRSLAAAAAALSLVLMVLFLGPTKLLPIAASLALLWAVLTDWSPVPARG